MKKLGYYLFNIVYYIFYLIPINKNKIFLIMTHDDSTEGNVLYTANYFMQKNPNIFFKSITREDYEFKKNSKIIEKVINFFILVPYHVATSKNIFLDNIFLPFAYTKFKKNVNIVQLWHGTGTIKKFALNTEVGEIRDLAKSSSVKNTHLIVGSQKMVPIYKSAFQMDLNKIYPIGTPRTDIFFNENLINEKIKEFYENYPELTNKKLILYAPTFRDEEYKKKLNNSSENIDINTEILKILNYLPEDYILILRLHPYISNRFSLKELNLSKKIEKRVFNLSKYNEVNTLLFVSDVLITDYSSIIFEYSLLNKKMIFYPYDLKEFEEKSRGFYFDYESFVPGIILTNIEDIGNYIKNTDKEYLKIIKTFKNKYMEKSDGFSTKRLFNILNNNKN
nr:CDP-glycerol glycerophosphotransferase family protein [Methanobrevibacter arboriphilus]